MYGRLDFRISQGKLLLFMENVFLFCIFERKMGLYHDMREMFLSFLISKLVALFLNFSRGLSFDLVNYEFPEFGFQEREQEKV